jgi:hypothetical protein
MGLDANDCTFNGNNIAESRFEIVNRGAKNANPSCQRDLPPKRDKPPSLQCKGKRINGVENLGQRPALTARHLSRF